MPERRYIKRREKEGILSPMDVALETAILAIDATT
jgi:hypothetical protein